MEQTELDELYRLKKAQFDAMLRLARLLKELSNVLIQTGCHPDECHNQLYTLLRRYEYVLNELHTCSDALQEFVHSLPEASASRAAELLNGVRSSHHDDGNAEEAFRMRREKNFSLLDDIRDMDRELDELFHDYHQLFLQLPPEIVPQRENGSTIFARRCGQSLYRNYENIRERMKAELERTVREI